MIEKEVFGMAEGYKVFLFTLRNSSGMTVKLTNYSGAIVSIIVPDKNGDMGDVVLAKVANILAETLPEKGFASRWGGEEFLFVLPDADTEEGVKAADKILQHIRAEVFSAESENFSVTMTIGICEACPGELIDSIITRADQRLYKGKHNGKNHTEYED